jgi:membrane protein
LEEARGESIPVGFAFDAMSYDTDTGAPVLAAALGFRVFLFMVPYVCMFMIICGFVSDVFNRDPRTMFRGSGIAHLTAESVATTASFSEGKRVITLLVVAYALFLSARSFVKVLYIVHALVWAVPRSKATRPNRAALIFIIIVTVAAALAALIDKLDQRVALGAVASLLLYTVLIIGGWWYVNWWLPHRNCPPIALMPGATVFGVGSIILEAATVIWFPHYLAGRSDLYGTLGVSVAILLWAYFLGRLMTLAAVLNASLWAHFGPESEHPVDFHRPSWRVPLLDDKVGRLWTFLFGIRDRDEAVPPP